MEEPTAGETALQEPGKRSTLEPGREKPSPARVHPAPSTNKIKHCAIWGEMFRVSIFIFSEQAMKDDGFEVERQ